MARTWTIRVVTPEERELVSEYNDVPDSDLPNLLASIKNKMLNSFDDEELFEYWRPDQVVELTLEEEF